MQDVEHLPRPLGRMDLPQLKEEALRFYAKEVKEGMHGVPLAVLYGGFMTFLFFAGAVVFPVLVPSYNKLGKQTRTDWRNRAVAFVHASIMTFLAWRCTAASVTTVKPQHGR